MHTGQIQRMGCYEFTTRLLPYSEEACSDSSDREMNAEGWSRVWADVHCDYVFIVYQRVSIIKLAALGAVA